ncbi:MAG: site-specific integrase [Pseudonocardia sp.]|nr:site-specific integrase [Pseudonocardia sp.]
MSPISEALALSPAGRGDPAGSGQRSGRQFPHVLAGVVLTGQAAVLAGRLDPRFLGETGWDPVTRVWSPPADHRLLGRPLCAAPGCSTTANGVCLECRGRLEQHDLTVAEVGLLAPPAGRAWTRPDDGACRVGGCPRPWVNTADPLCRAHLDQQRTLGGSVAEFVTRPDARALPSLGQCAVAACARQLPVPAQPYCPTHLSRLRRARRGPGGVDDEGRWRATEAPVTRAGHAVLAALPVLVVVQVLYGIQQRAGEGIRARDPVLRWICAELRRQQVSTIAGTVVPGDTERRGAINALIKHARRGLLDPEDEIGKDEWDMTVFGHRGNMSFVAITQDWLRATAKAWASHDLPRRRGAYGGDKTRHHISSLALLSESLRSRPDRGADPAALGRADIEAFLARLSYLETNQQISTLIRHVTCTEVRAVLTPLRSLGLTVPGAPAAGLSDGFALRRDDIPARPEQGEPGRDLPPQILRQLGEHLAQISSPQVRTAVEIAMDTGRRPEEICALGYDCLARDTDGAAVLVYDNHKANRLARRLPISAKTAEAITAQQQRVRHRYPDTAIGTLKLLPSRWRNPDGARTITVGSLEQRHREWIDALPVLRTNDGAEFDKARAVLYAYRHSYAQRHADAGVGIDVLAELLDHRNLNVTRRYYRVGQHRRRAAVDTVTERSFDRHGNRIWRDAQTLLDSEHARSAIGEIAVPYGRCTEPSNVQAGGGACPIRFRCAGCDHFRTDVSYLPDLQAYLDDLLRTRERLAAADGVDDWARADATPSTEEITRIRQLITRIKDDVAELDPTERTQIDDAIAAVRRHRAAHTVTLGMPTLATRTPIPGSAAGTEVSA